MKTKIFTIVSVVVIAVLYYFSISGLKGVENNIPVNNPAEITNESNNIESLSLLKGLNLYSTGQRLIYEVSGDENNRETNFGFCYEYCMPGTYTLDSEKTVLHTVPGINSPGYLCKDIYENLQHSDLFDSGHNDKVNWYIKPVMRISG